MRARDQRAPIFTTAYDLCRWLSEQLDQKPGWLARDLGRDAFAVLQLLTLALQERSRDERIDAADERLVALRLRLRLAADCGLLTDRQALYALGQADNIGRQIGGWQRSLEEG